jgi:hypothetical protein
MPNLLLSDYAVTTLASSFDADAGTFTVAPGTGALFPTPIGGTGTYMILTLEDEAGNTEKIKVSHRAGDVFGSNTYPIQRGYGGTSARAWTGGDSLSLRWNKTTAEEMAAEAAEGAFAAHVVEPDPHPQYLQLDDVAGLFVERSSVTPYMQAVFGSADAATVRGAIGAMSASVVLGNYRGVAYYEDTATLSLTHAGKLLLAGSTASTNWAISLPTPTADDIGKRFMLLNTSGKPLVISPPAAVAPDEAVLMVDNANVATFTLPATDTMEFTVVGYGAISGGGNKTTWVGLHVHKKTPVTVNTFNGRTGAVALTSADVTSALGYTPANTSHTHSYVATDSSSGRVGSYGTATGSPTSANATISGVGSWAPLGGGTWRRAYGVGWDRGPDGDSYTYLFQRIA